MQQPINCLPHVNTELRPAPPTEETEYFHVIAMRGGGKAACIAATAFHGNPNSAMVEILDTFQAPKGTDPNEAWNGRAREKSVDGRMRLYLMHRLLPLLEREKAVSVEAMCALLLQHYDDTIAQGQEEADEQLRVAAGELGVQVNIFVSAARGALPLPEYKPQPYISTRRGTRGSTRGSARGGSRGRRGGYIY